ncbi:MAG: glycerol-3-phosphate 1-O-acyltransferase PlsY [Chloroflexota bacterium]
MLTGKFITIAIIGYLLGSIPSGLIMAKLSGKGDIRNWGSGKTGATNVLRAVGKKAALLTALLDIAKGMSAVFFASVIMSRYYLVVGDYRILWLLRSAQVVAALSAIAGHNWPLFLGFKGGRGVSTFMGGLIALCPVAALFSGEMIIIGAGLTRYASLANIAGIVGASAILLPLTVLNGFPVEYLFYALVGGGIVIWMHRDNIKRLMAGKERKLGEKEEKPKLTLSEDTEK